MLKQNLLNISNYFKNNVDQSLDKNNLSLSKDNSLNHKNIVDNLKYFMNMKGGKNVKKMNNNYNNNYNYVMTGGDGNEINDNVNIPYIGEQLQNLDIQQQQQFMQNLNEQQLQNQNVQQQQQQPQEQQQDQQQQYMQNLNEQQLQIQNLNNQQEQLQQQFIQNLIPQKNIINKNVQEVFIQKPEQYDNTYTITKGTILFHASSKKTFNPNNIKLNEKTLSALFTPNFKLSSEQIKSCGIENQNSYIHAFETVEDIKYMYVHLPYEFTSIEELQNKFCNGNDSMYNGVAFFYPKNEIDEFNNFMNGEQLYTNENKYYSEFLICNPNNYLKYLYTQRCMSLRHLSEQYRFD